MSVTPVPEPPRKDGRTWYMLSGTRKLARQHGELPRREPRKGRKLLGRGP